MATENHFSYTDGFNCFKNTVYVLTFSENQPYTEKEILGILNSSTSDFIFKQISPFVNDRYYRYKSQYTEKIPLPEQKQGVEEVVETLLEIDEMKMKMERFPHSYIQSNSGELEYISYEWKTRRQPVNASIERREEGDFAVEAGRTDSITDPRMESEDRAQYVHAAVDGRNVKSGEEVSIPIPRRDEDVRALLAELENDRTTIEETDIAELEAEIDEIVYDLFDLADEERDVIEDYLDVF